MDERAIDRRLARVEGQVRGVRKMVSEGAYCVDVLNQLSAVKSALEQVSAAVASQHIRHCIAEGEGHSQAKAMSRDDLLDELDDVLRQLVR